MAKGYKHTMTELMKTCEIPNIQDKLKADLDDIDKDVDLNLSNPNSRVSSFIL